MALVATNAINAFFVDSSDICDPELEACPTSEELTDYEDYKRFTLLIGIVLTVSGYLPMFLFLYPIWYGIDQTDRTKIRNDHIYYFGSWVYMAAMHFILYVPW